MPINCHDLPVIESIAGRVASDFTAIGPTFGRNGNVNNNTWLRYEENFSNSVGSPFGYNNGELTEVWCGQANQTSFTITIYWHLGQSVSLTPLVTLVIPSGTRTFTFTNSDILAANLGSKVNIPSDVQLAIKVTGGSAVDPICELKLRGTR